MKSADKFLFAIVAGVVLIIGIAITVIVLKPEPSYLPEDTPGGVAHNYLLALQKSDYTRAYSYLSKDLPGYPKNITEFRQSLEEEYWNFQTIKNASLKVDSFEIFNSQATVIIDLTYFYDRGLFESSQSFTTFTMDLVLVQDKWVLIDSDRWFAWCWNQETGCEK